jgi:hypothetical protein
MSALVSTVSAYNPLNGVKRSSLSGGGVASQLPAKRGREVEPAGPVRAPALRNGNRPNSGTNVTIPYARVSPIRFFDESSGVRMSPGDVLFVRKQPGGETDARDYMMEPNVNVNRNGVPNGILLPQQARWRRQSERNKIAIHPPAPYGLNDVINPHLSNMSKHERSEFSGVPQRRILSSHTHRVLGIDGMNEMLRGGASNMNMRVGVNVLEVANPVVDLLPGPYGFLRKLEMLDEYALDGVVLSNDEPDSFSSNGIRDNVVFNVAVQGRALLNNGFWMHEDLDDPDSSLSNSIGVEAHPRSMRDHTVQMNPMVARSAAWNGTSQYGNSSFDFVAQFKGQYTSYPIQMFDRNPMVGVKMYVGLRAILCTEQMKNSLKDRNGKRYEAVHGKLYLYFQYMPYSQRICDIIEMTNAARVLSNNGNPGPLAILQAGARDSSRRMLKTGIETDPYAPIKQSDWEMMVGAWTVGTVIDTCAAKHEQFNSGPPDTSFQCTVNVNVNWMERTHDKAPPWNYRSLTNSYTLAPNMFQYMGQTPFGPVKRCSGPKFASSLRESMIVLRGHQQNPTMASRIPSRIIMNTNASVLNKGGFMKKNLPVLAHKLTHLPDMLLNLQIMGFSISGKGSDKKSVIMPSGDRVEWIKAANGRSYLMPSSTLPVHVVSSWSAMVTELEEIVTVLQNRRSGVTTGDLIQTTPDVTNFVNNSTSAIMTPKMAFRYVLYLVVRMARQAVCECENYLDSIHESEIFQRAFSEHKKSGTKLNIHGSETDFGTRELFMNLLYVRNEMALYWFLEKLWATIRTKGRENDDFPQGMFDALWDVPLQEYSTFAGKFDASVKCIEIGPPPEHTDVLKADQYKNLPWNKSALSLGADANEIQQSLRDTLFRTLDNGNFTSFFTFQVTELGYLGHARARYNLNAGEYTDDKEGIRNVVLTGKTLYEYEPANPVTVFGSQLMYPRDEFEYRAIQDGDRSKMFNDEKDDGTGTRTNPYAAPVTDQRPSFRAAVGLKDSTIKRAWVMIHRALRRHPAIPGDALGAILGKQLYDVLRIPMFMTNTTGANFDDQLNNTKIQFYSMYRQFTFGAALRDMLLVGADLFFVRGEQVTNGIQNSGNNSNPKQSWRLVSAGELAIQELIRRISRSVPNDDPRYGRLHKDTPYDHTLSLKENEKKAKLDYEEVPITWEHFYTYFATHGESDNTLAAKTAEMVGEEHRYYYSRTKPLEMKRVMPTNAAIGSSDEIDVQNAVLGKFALGEMPIVRSEHEDVSSNTMRDFSLQACNLLFSDDKLSTSDVDSAVRVPTKADVESHYSMSSNAGNKTAASSSAQPVADVVMESVSTFEPVETSASCVFNEALAPTLALEATPAPGPAPVPARTEAPAPAPVPGPALAPVPARTGAPGPAPVPARTEAPGPAPVPARTEAPDPAPVPAPAPAPVPARTGAPAQSTRKKSPLRAPLSTSASGSSSRVIDSSRVRVELPTTTTTTTSSPRAVSQMASIGGASAVKAPKSRSSTAAGLASSSSAPVSMTPTVSSVFGNLFGGSPGGAEVPRSPSPTQSSESNDTTGGPKVQHRKSRS